MKHIKLEVYVDATLNVAHCMRESPAFGEIGSLSAGHIQCATLNDGQHRVVVGVYNRPISLDDMKRFARLAVTQPCDT